LTEYSSLTLSEAFLLNRIFHHKDHEGHKEKISKNSPSHAKQNKGLAGFIKKALGSADGAVPKLVEEK
jgi:hypothetical protein